MFTEKRIGSILNTEQDQTYWLTLLYVADLYEMSACMLRLSFIVLQVLVCFGL